MWTLRHRRKRWLTVEKVCETLTDLKAASPVVTLAPSLAEMKAHTPGKTLSYVLPQALVETQAVAVAEEVTKTIKDTLTRVKPKAERLAEVKAETIGERH